jgi:hypothetical protein
MRRLAIAAALIILAVGPALAQAPPAGTPTRIRGTIDKLDGQTLVVKSREGPVLTIALAPNFVVSGVIKKSMADIKPGDFVASTSVKGTDGKLHAVEVHILPDALRGVVPEAQYPWDLVPDSLMTNAIASGIVQAPGGGQVLKLTYKGTEAEVIVGPDVPVASSVPGDASLLKPGAAVYIAALKKDDGSLTAARVTAEKDGVKPPL